MTEKEEKLPRAGTPVVPVRSSGWRKSLFWSAIVILIALPCGGVPVLCVTLPAIFTWVYHAPFDSTRWKETTDTSARYDMSWDLVHGGMLTGKTAPEVEELLGKPMTTDLFRPAALPKFSTPDFKPGIGIWYYDLGSEKYESGLGPSGAVLAVDFRGGQVIGVRKVVH